MKCMCVRLYSFLYFRGIWRGDTTIILARTHLLSTGLGSSLEGNPSARRPVSPPRHIATTPRGKAIPRQNTTPSPTRGGSFHSACRDAQHLTTNPSDRVQKGVSSEKEQIFASGSSSHSRLSPRPSRYRSCRPWLRFGRRLRRSAALPPATFLCAEMQSQDQDHQLVDTGEL